MRVEHIEAPYDFDGYEGRIATILHRQPWDVEPFGVQSLTEAQEYLQTLYVKYPRDHVIPNHIHLATTRTIHFTQEVLFFLKGRAQVRFYTPSQKFLAAVEVKWGDVVIIYCGGHGITMLEETEILEVKQGPYAGRDRDKMEF